MNEGGWTRWTGTYEFDACTQTEQRTRYREKKADQGKRCRSEIQTRTMANRGDWSDWTGSPKIYNETKCVPGAATVQTRIRWYEPVTMKRCKSQVQQRTIEAPSDKNNNQPDTDPPWKGGVYNYSTCALVQKRTHYKMKQGAKCVGEEQSRSSPGTSGAWENWNGEYMQLTSRSALLVLNVCKLRAV